MIKSTITLLIGVLIITIDLKIFKHVYGSHFQWTVALACFLLGIYFIITDNWKQEDEQEKLRWAHAEKCEQERFERSRWEYDTGK